jgi:hypothetical protein
MWNCRPPSLVPACGVARSRITFHLIALALLPTIVVLAVLVAAITLPAGSSQKKERKLPPLEWDPPQVDAPVRGVSATPPCALPDVLKQAGERAQELIANLRDFDAHERIRYAQIDDLGISEMSVDAKFDYLVDFGEKSETLTVHETRTPLAGFDNAHVGEIADRGLPVLALIFNPNLQSDYEMRCEGFAQWDNQPAWVVYFRQNKGKPARTFGIRTEKRTLQVGLKGRAWIAPDSGQVIHLETSLVQGLASIGLQGNAVSVDYAPVKFQSRDVVIWLPQSATAYSDYGKRRMIIGHTFSDFQLFSVQTQQVIEKPKTP